MTKQVIALVGDLINSRKISSRIEFDDSLLAVLEARNQLNPSILSPYTLIGDEIQAVYSNADFLFVDCIKILSTIYPERMRFSFGVGNLIKPINRDQAIEMDGPAFYSARDGVNELKKSEELFIVKGETLLFEKLINSMLFYISHSMKKWGGNRLQILSILLEEKSVKEISSKLDVSYQAIYKSVDVGALDLIKDIFQETAITINRSV